MVSRKTNHKFFNHLKWSWVLLFIKKNKSINIFWLVKVSWVYEVIVSLKIHNYICTYEQKIISVLYVVWHSTGQKSLQCLFHILGRNDDFMNSFWNSCTVLVQNSICFLYIMLICYYIVSKKKVEMKNRKILELVSKELNHLAAILHVYAGGLIFMK